MVIDGFLWVYLPFGLKNLSIFFSFAIAVFVKLKR